MIFEELQEEIDQKSNRLVIDKVASLLADPAKWDELFVFFEDLNFNKYIDKESRLAIKLRYVHALRKYVRSKIQAAKARRRAHHYDWPISKTYYDQYIQYEKDLSIAICDKKAAREEMILHGLDYEQYHNNLTTKFY